MALKVLHTSDLHIGKKFAGYDHGVQEALAEFEGQLIAVLPGSHDHLSPNGSDGVMYKAWKTA